MSLLLDAMKKAAGGKATPSSDNSATQTPSSNSETRTPASRAAGENLFAAKKKKPAPGFRWTLGLIPSTLLICSVLGAGYGYYVWREISMPAQPQAVAQAAPPPAPAPISTPILPSPKKLVAAIPQEEVLTELPQEVKAPQATSTKTSTANKNDGAKPRPREATRAPVSAPNAPAPVNFKHQQEGDPLMPALLNAYQAYQRGDYVTAAQGYHGVLKQDSLNRDALLGLGAIAQQQGQDQMAQHYYHQVLQLNPRDPVALGAMSAYTNNNDADAESQLKSSLAEQPRSSALNYALGNVYADQSRWAEAQQAYFNAHMIEPSNAQFTYNLAVSMDHLGQGKLAAQFYQQALQLDADNNAGFDHAQAQQRLNELTPSH